MNCSAGQLAQQLLQQPRPAHRSARRVYGSSIAWWRESSQSGITAGIDQFDADRARVVAAGVVGDARRAHVLMHRAVAVDVVVAAVAGPGSCSGSRSPNSRAVARSGSSVQWITTRSTCVHRPRRPGALRRAADRCGRRAAAEVGQHGADASIAPWPALPPDSELARLMARFPARRAGRLDRRAAGARRRCARSTAREAVAGEGLVGRPLRRRSGKRGITLIQAEHLPVIAALAGHRRRAARLLRRNLVVAGIPLVALKDRRFRIGEVVLEGTGPCDPCSRMEARSATAATTRCAAWAAYARASSKAARSGRGDRVAAVDA